MYLSNRWVVVRVASWRTGRTAINLPHRVQYVLVLMFGYCLLPQPRQTEGA